MTSPVDVRRLVVLRHAEASGAAPSDHERDLTDAGRVAAGELGRWLVAEGHAPAAVLMSDARRTQRTWEEAAASADLLDVPTEVSPALYTASPESALDLLRRTSAETGTLLLLAHNPTVAALAQLLHDGRGDGAATTRMAGGYPPCAATVLDVPLAWSSLEWGTARLVDFHVPG